MINLTRVVLDVLKPHQPGPIDFARRLAETSPGLVVNLLVIEMDDKTHTLQIEIAGPDIPLDDIEHVINGMGGSLHSVDEVQVENSTTPEQNGNG